MRSFVLMTALVLVGCGSAPEPAAEKKAEVKPAEAKPKPVRDHTSVLPTEGQMSAKVSQENLLGMKSLPGGSIGDYKAKGKTYQMFLIEADNNEKAAMILFNAKAEMKDPTFVASFGGYFGEFNGQKVFLFSKKYYVAGVVGLDQKDADAMGRILAGQI